MTGEQNVRKRKLRGLSSSSARPTNAAGHQFLEEARGPDKRKRTQFRRGNQGSKVHAEQSVAGRAISQADRLSSRTSAKVNDKFILPVKYALQRPSKRSGRPVHTPSRPARRPTPARSRIEPSEQPHGAQKTRKNGRFSARRRRLLAPQPLPSVWDGLDRPSDRLGTGPGRPSPPGRVEVQKSGAAPHHADVW